MGVDAAMTPRLPERSRADPDADLVTDARYRVLLLDPWVGESGLAVAA